MKYIDADRLRAEIENLIERYSSIKAKGILQEGYKGGRLIGYEDALNKLDSLQQEQPEVDLDKLVNEEFASHSRTTEYGLEATYNRAELYQLIKRMALVFNARKEENK